MGNSPSKLAKLSEPTRPFQGTKGVPNKLLQLKFIARSASRFLYTNTGCCVGAWTFMISLSNDPHFRAAGHRDRNGNGDAGCRSISPKPIPRTRLVRH